MKKFVAEAIGTFWLVFGGCGSALLAAGVENVGIGFLGVSLAFGLTVVTMAYAIGHISGAHLNPAVTIGLWVGGRFSAKDVMPYIIAQCLGGLIAAAALYVIVTGNGSEIGSFAANGYGEYSPGGYSMQAGMLTEFILTLVFLVVIMGATHKNAASKFAGLAIGLALTLIHLISIPVTNTSVNPARSLSQAAFVGDWALGQLWVFVLFPIAGAIVGGLLYRWLSGGND
ncbi:aquaporin Z [Gilvibacter sp.]|uniref:aquaporin Z n=1 Tax=Gilvibacter sp. TaxID=2729997 RepID=UPI0025B8B308|nr:aquaporin Z [Gilvibacter sp.]NQX76335.1 aquaporin Z [Gilvibacter sp.]